MKPRLIHPLKNRSQTARGVALSVLLDCARRDAFIQEILNDHLSRSSLSGPDRRLATQLAYGVLRRRGTLDALLATVSKRPREQVEPMLWEILRVGTFQLALLTQIPPHAAVHETVELAPPQARGFVNGNLRALSRLLTDERAATPAVDALPLEDGAYRKLDKPVLPDPSVAPVQYFATAFSLPAWLAQRWSDRFTWDECVPLGFWFAGGAPLWLRCNALKIDRDSFLEALKNAGIGAMPGEHPQAIRLEDAVAVRDLPGYDQGWFAVQDASAMKAATALAPRPGDRVLDLCAAPGGKTTHLAELKQNQGSIVACDVDERRLATVRELAQRLGHTIIQPRLVESPEQPEPPAGPFDAVLVDVPCSNTGVLGRRPEVRWRLKPADFRRLVPLQTKLLLQAAERVRPGGAVLYSTCSIEPEENRGVVNSVLQAVPTLTLEAEEEQIPGKPADGGYWARLRRA